MKFFLVSLSRDMRKGGHMNEVLKINYETEQPTVSARELHEALALKSFLSSFDRKIIPKNRNKYKQ